MTSRSYTRSADESKMVAKPNLAKSPDVPVCKYFSGSKTCTFGGRCRYLHQNQPVVQGFQPEDGGSQYAVRPQSTKQLGMDLGLVLYGTKQYRLLVVGDGDFSFAAHIAETTQAKLVASCQESCAVFHSRQDNLLSVTDPVVC